MTQIKKERILKITVLKLENLIFELEPLTSEKYNLDDNEKFLNLNLYEN